MFIDTRNWTTNQCLFLNFKILVQADYLINIFDFQNTFHSSYDISKFHLQYQDTELVKYTRL